MKKVCLRLSHYSCYETRHTCPFSPAWYRDKVARKYGVRGVAILLSLPLVLLVWAILTFSFSILCYSFRGYTQTIEGSLERFGSGTAWTVTGVAVAIVFTRVLVLYSFWDLWQRRHHNYQGVVVRRIFPQRVVAIVTSSLDWTVSFFGGLFKRKIESSMMSDLSVS